MEKITKSPATRVLEKWERKRLGEEAFGASQEQTTGGHVSSATHGAGNPNPMSQPMGKGWKFLRSIWLAPKKGKKERQRTGSWGRNVTGSSKFRLKRPGSKEKAQEKTPRQGNRNVDPPRRVTGSVTRSLTALAPLVPDLLKEEILRTPTLGPSMTPRVGAVMIADITGFTRLTETLSLEGTHGVELLTRCMNSYFAEMIEVVSSFGGDVVKFAGDSLVVAFVEAETGSRERLELVTGRALACGMELTTRLGEMRMLPNGNVLSAKELTGGRKKRANRLWPPSVRQDDDDGSRSRQSRLGKLFGSLCAGRPPKEDVTTPRSTDVWSFFSSRRGVASPRSPRSSTPFSPKIGAYRQGAPQKSVWSEEFTLSLKVLVGAGELCLFNVGGELEDTQEDDSTPRWEFFIGDAPHREVDAFGRRPPIQQIAAIERHAEPGDVVVSKEIAHHLISCIDLEDGAGRIRSIDTRLGALKNSSAPISHASLALLPRGSQAKSVESMRMYVVDCVRQRVEVGHADFISEMRFLTMLFIGFPDLTVPRAGEDMSVAGDVEQVQACILACQTAMNELDGSLLQMRCDEKGFLAVCALGLGGRSHMQQAVRGVQAAIRVRELALASGNETAIGVTTGELLCACVGSRARMEYTVFGDSINASARLMCKAKAGWGGILCDQETFDRARGKAEFVPLEPMVLKGRSEVFQAYRVAPLARGTRERRQTSFSPLHAPLVGRQEVMENIMDSMRSFVQVSGGVILVEGEPGMGKTKIVRELECGYFAATCEDWAHIHDNVHMFSGAGSPTHRSHCLFPWRRVLEDLFLVDKQARWEGKAPLAHMLEDRIEQFEDHWRYVLAGALDLPLESIPSSLPPGERSGLVNWTTTRSTVSSQEIDEEDWERTGGSGSVIPSCEGCLSPDDDLDEAISGGDESEGDLPPLQFVEGTSSDSEVPGAESRCEISSESATTVEEPVRKHERPPPLDIACSTGEFETSGPPTERTVTFGNTKSFTYSPDSYLTTREITPGSSLCDTSSWRGDQIEGLIVEIVQCFVEQYGPCIMVLEDLHHFDLASWSLLAALDHNVGPSGLLVIGTLRPNEGSLAQASKSKLGVYQSIMKCYKAIRESGSTARISLPPLNLGETRALMELVAGDQTIPDDVVVAVLEKSGGVPIYIQQLTQYLVETGLITGDGGSVGETLNTEATIAGFIRNTMSIHHLLMDQIDGLSSTGHLTLKVAAVIGADITAQVIREVYPYNTYEYDVEIDMVELEGVGFITRCEETRHSHRTQRWRFNNQVARDAVYGLIPNGQRRRLHAKFAQVLQEGGDWDDSIVAFHWEKSSEGVEAVEWRRTLKAISGWQRAGVYARDHGGLSQALDCFQRAVHLQEKLIEFHGQSGELVDIKVSKLLAESAEATPLTPRTGPYSGLPDDISLGSCSKSSAHSAALPYIAVLDRVRIQRWMAEIEKELAESEPNSERKTVILHAACDHLVIALDLLGAPCPGELIARKESKKGFWAKVKGGFRIGKSMLKTTRQWVANSSRGSYGMPRPPRRRRKSMAPYFLGETAKTQRRLTEEEMLEAARLMDMYVAIAVALGSRSAVVHCTDLLEFFVKDRVGQSCFARVAERLNTEGTEVLLPRVLSERFKKRNKGKSPTVTVREVSRFGSDSASIPTSSIGRA
ncbi:hypothetical protein BSKO_10193 [Bryopsis sp. KO-2023]|nr:hypothetical protein BSKO_10193 [Bryopsis sp. KO-2023]